MFYTKYRPQKFDDISKPNAIADALATQVKSKKTVHAYLFIGPRGTGKTTTARILAKALNCEDIDKDGNPCDECDVCSAIKLGNFMDLIEIDAASNRGIDDIRELRDRIKLAPASGKQKVYIIDEVHMLTTEAFNALLKTLEEPPAHATFILCTTEDHKVPDTIKSRCQVFKFKRASVDQIVTKLEAICATEKAKSKIKKEDLIKIAKASLGGFRDAETMLQQVLEGELDIDMFVGSSSKKELLDFVDYLNIKDSASALRLVNKIFEDGMDLHTWTLELLKHLRDLLFIASDAHEGLLDLTDEMFVSMEEQASKLDPISIAHYLEIFAPLPAQIKISSIPQLSLEIAIVKLCGDTSEPSVTFNHEPKKSGGDTRTSNEKKTVISAKSNLNTKIEDVHTGWEDVLKGVVKHNHGVQALLKATKPFCISEDSLVIEVFYKFHKERLETPRNKEIVESVLATIFGEEMSLKCILSDEPAKTKTKNETGELTDLNIKVARDFSTSDSLLEVFDGGLPL